MDFGHKIIRTTIGTIIDKSILDIKSDSERSIKKLVDMGEYFAKTPVQKEFFKLCTSVVNNPTNPYYKIITHLANDVDKKYIKTFGLNFGYQSLTYGADIIRKQEDTLKKRIPWMIVFDLTSDDEMIISLDKLNKIINEANELGIFAFIILVNNQTALQLTADIAKQHTESAFIVSASYEYVNNVSIPFIEDVTNLVISINIDTDNIDEEALQATFDTLHQNQLLYGFNISYSKSNAEFIMSDEFISKMINSNCIFGCMLRQDKDDLSTDDKIYDFVCNIRNVNGRPLLLFDYYRDYEFISTQIDAAGDIIIIASDGLATNGSKELSTDINSTSLEEAINTLMPVNC